MPLTSDYGFEATFGNEGNTLLLRTALQALIESAVPIREVQLEKNAFEVLTLNSRSGIFELAWTDGASHHFIVEMQLGHAFCLYMETVKMLLARIKAYPSHYSLKNNGKTQKNHR
ncbi:PD-(D/E)XK nuclease family transposase [Hymenobacter montanus]|uniref:PD-(D/E)XK nuclease family transposase n=1 Tax=Hymenobacter montanus TaxID=2771359 RepID=UPI00293BB4C1|nr:PD-(D/E)XK nuclease family transposase [Hymenobacter montanus]